MESSADPVADFSIAIPVYNEERNIAPLLDALLAEGDAASILVSDDGSTDRSREIVERYQLQAPTVVSLTTGGRCGPLEGWRVAIQAARTRIVVLLDADVSPAKGAIRKLVEAVARDETTVVASGRVVARNDLSRFPAARFRAKAMHRLRSLGYVRDAIIGRFAALKREWFLSSIRERGVIACDAYLGCVADAQGLKALYVPEAECYYTEATTIEDFASQRQRADEGYRQLRERGWLTPEQEARFGDYLYVVLNAAKNDPSGAISWTVAQIKSKLRPPYRSTTAGAWEALESTKR
jgi:glycosyltransferase involved in cell wall biosynthesis